MDGTNDHNPLKGYELVNLISPEKRFTVREGIFEDLGAFKGAGNTWDDDVQYLIQARRKQNVREMFERAHDEEQVPLEDALVGDRVAYTVILDQQPAAFLENADEKTERIDRDKLAALVAEPHPYPGAGIDGRKCFTVDEREVVSYYIGRTLTGFYTVHEGELEVRARQMFPTTRRTTCTIDGVNLPQCSSTMLGGLPASCCRNSSIPSPTSRRRATRCSREATSSGRSVPVESQKPMLQVPSSGPLSKQNTQRAKSINPIPNTAKQRTQMPVS